MRTILLTVIFVPLLAMAQPHTVGRHAEDREQYDRFFDLAGAEFGVPSDLLRGLSFAETRWTHMTWPEGETNSSCTGMPRVYGVMGLWDNDYFGHSLREAAALIGLTPEELKLDPLQNIRGAAALLKRYYEETARPDGFAAGTIESWQNAVARFSGFPQQEIAQRRGLEVYTLLSAGYARDRIRIEQRSVDLPAVERYVRSFASSDAAVSGGIAADGAASQPDYPLAKWNPAVTGNFGTTLIQQKFVVIHDVEGSYLGCISWFKNTSAGVSAHYVLNTHPNGVNSTTKAPNTTADAPVGEVTQMVEEKYRAYHVGCWNSYMIGIEHEGYASVSGWYTPEGMTASSKLVKYLCDKYNIPKDRNHVIAHQEWQNAAWRNWVTSTGQGFDPTCNTHVDPGIYWNWTSFMSMVTTADTVRPVVTAALPESNLNSFPAYKEITVKFNTPMDMTTTNAAFSIQPAVAGTKVWNEDNTILTFDPSALLPWNTAFTVKIDTTAKNIAKSRNLGTTPYVVMFTTVPLDTVGPVVERTYPLSNETGVSLYGDVVLDLNEPVQTISLSGTVKMTDPNNVNVPLANAKNEIVMDKGIVSFVPTNLKPNTVYTVKLLAGVKDTYGNSSKSDLIYQFTTSSEVVTAGMPLDNLDANTKGWMQPEQGDRTRSIDTGRTALTFGTEKVKAGSGAAKLVYAFTGADSGAVELKATGFPPIDFYQRVGLWVSGDASSNTLELRFAPNDQVLSVGPLYWRGWKFVQFPISSVSGANKILKSIVLRQQPGGGTSGRIYLDEMQVDANVVSSVEQEGTVPAVFTLHQNFPNPFNPSTTVVYDVPVPSHVTVTVYDMLGREVMLLTDAPQQPGTYRMTLDASSLSSGVYFYTLRSGDFSQTRSMVVLK
ncbi:MAG: Ig-like domain-containing protein [Bacteroidetes bacterium]|nr:Ig-like domain-containing protein [Bacteroidota bacterium]